jgi:hypothetical protein
MGLSRSSRRWRWGYRSIQKFGDKGYQVDGFAAPGPRVLLPYSAMQALTTSVEHSARLTGLAPETCESLEQVNLVAQDETVSTSWCGFYIRIGDVATAQICSADLLLLSPTVRPGCLAVLCLVRSDAGNACVRSISVVQKSKPFSRGVNSSATRDFTNTNTTCCSNLQLP